MAPVGVCLSGLMKRKIDLMHAYFGILPDKRCEDCSNLIKGEYHNLHLRKCTVYGATHSEASDWRKKYVACGLFNKEWNGGRVMDIRYKESGESIEEIVPLEGQIAFWELEDGEEDQPEE